MRINHRLGGFIAPLAAVALSPAALAQHHGHACSACSIPAFEGPVSPTPALEAAIELSLFNMLPEDQKVRIATAELERLNAMGDAIAAERDAAAMREGPFDYSKVEAYISRESWDSLRPFHQKMLIEIEANMHVAQEHPLALCFTPDADPGLVFAVSEMMGYSQTTRFQQTGRWSSTIASGGGLGQGDPTIITYSYIPDGTNIPAQSGLGGGSSQLFAWLNGIYGSPAVWQPLFDGVFERWSQVAGLSFVALGTDDGATFPNADGQLGVRGDVRIGAVPLDGNSGVLAYNFFPQTGDMVFDAFDSFYNSTGGDSLRFRNVISHEHGHGLGMLHVCPANQSKLMEPFVSTAYDGPQPDDILNGQRHYGDPLEPNDNAPQASGLGSLSSGQSASVNDVSIDDNSDVDYFSFTVGGAQGIEITVTPAAPAPYQQGPQTQQCNTGTVTDYNAIHNLSIELLGTNGSTVLDSSNTAGLGQAETLTTSVGAAGTYFIRVNGGSTNSIQLYDLGLDVTPPPFLGVTISFPNGTPDFIDPGVVTPVEVTIDPRDESLVGTPQLSFAADGSNYSNSSLVSNGGTSWTANLPASLCADTPAFFISAQGTVTGTQLAPAAGPGAPFTPVVGQQSVAFEDDFETNQGWTVTNIGLTDGAWERGVPAGGGDRGDPPTDFDGSGQCYVTDNADDNSDVDGGQTILTSPVFNGTNATLSYARWFDNTAGSNPGTKTFVVEISNNGGSSWQNLETVGPNTSESGGGWFFVSFDIASEITPSSNMRVRFIAQDPDPGAVVEAAVDAFSVVSFVCDDPPPPNCLADWNNSGGQPDSSDFLAYLNDWSAQDPDADLAPPGGNSVWDSADFLAYLNVYSQGC